MKITPLANSQAGTPGASLTPSTGTSASRDKIAAAKAIMTGAARVQESDTPVDEQVARIEASRQRRIKMRTNVSPDRSFEQSLIAETPIVAEQIGTSDVIDDAQKVSEETKPLSPQFAALARQKRALQVKESEIAAREKALADQSTSVDPSAISLADLKADPLGILLGKAGHTYESLTEAFSRGPVNAPNAQIEALEAKIASLEEGLTKNFSDRDAQAEQQVLTEISREIDSLVATGDDFETIRETRSQADVQELIHRTWKKTGEVLDTSEACKLVEEHLLTEVLKVAKLKKVQSRLTPAQEQQIKQQQRQITTLTNRDGSSPVLDKRARAMAAFYGMKK